jgi:hypothetical protein
MMKYEEYLGSEQKKEEDRVFLEFNRRHGADPEEGINAIRGAMLFVMIIMIIGLISWWAS